MKKYKAIFFDWDGTAVLSRTAPADDVLVEMKSLLENGVILLIISGTTYENIAGGRLHELLSREALTNLYLGLGRGAYNYGFSENGKPIVIKDMIPQQDEMLKLHDLCYEFHKRCLAVNGLNTDIVFSRPNYCKIDLMPGYDRKGKLFLQEGELGMIDGILSKHGIERGMKGIIEYVGELGKKYGISLKVTTDAKYLEIGVSTKADNVDYLLENIVLNKGIKINECCFWGDEFTFLGDGVKGSDAQMLTELSGSADFYDVSESPYRLPENVKHIGNGVSSFLQFLSSQMKYN